MQPEWAAAVLQSIVGTAVGLVGAVVILSRQLTHDRLLVQRQLEEERRLRISERRAIAASQLGEAIKDSLDLFAGRDPADVSEELTNPDFRSTIPMVECPGFLAIHRSYERALILLDLDDTLPTLNRERSNCWIVGRRLALDVARKQESERNAPRLGNMVTSLMRENTDRFRKYISALYQWDGFGSPPGREIFPDWEPTVEPEHRPRLLERATDIYRGRIRAVDFSMPDLAEAVIRDWDWLQGPPDSPASSN